MCKVPIKTNASTLISLFIFASFGVLQGCSSAQNHSKNVLEKSIEVLTPNSVVVKQVNETEYRLSLSVTDALSSFENSAMQIKADELCPEGFIKESQQAINRGLLLSRDCEFGQCSHQLNWAIKCKKLTKEPFSIFGKS